MKNKTIVCFLTGILLFSLLGCSSETQDSNKATVVDSSANTTDLKEIEKDDSLIKDAVESFKGTLKHTEETSSVIENSLKNDILTQTDMNVKAKELYELWDKALNELWGVLKQSLKEDTMNTLTKEQVQWIALKEKSVKDAGAEVEGGTIYPLVTNSKAAEMTKNRVYELMRYLD